MSDARSSTVVIRSGEVAWQPAPTPGVSVKALRRDKESGESTALVRFGPDTRFPAHNHPAGEEVFVIEGDLQIGPHRLRAGDYLYTPPSGTHAASSERGCVFLVALPKPIEILAT